MFERMKPSMGGGAAIGTLMALAKAEALRAAESDIGRGAMSERGGAALAHLSRYHKAALAVMLKENEVGL
jgi:hypothetical protein